MPSRCRPFESLLSRLLMERCIYDSCT
jgi:hypothetical protein